MRELEHLLPDLDPPPGGLARLQRSMQARQPAHRHRTRRWMPLVAGACALALLTLTWLPGVVVRYQRTTALTRVLRQAMAPTLPANGIRVVDGAALELPSAQANVRIYLVQADMPSTQPTP